MQNDSSEEQEEEIETRYIKYLIDYIPPEIQKIAKEELGETEEVKARCLRELKELIDSEPEFNPCTDEIFLLRFLRCRKYDVKRAFDNLINYYEFKARYSGVFAELTPFDIKHVLDLHHSYALEHRDPNHVGIAIFRMGQYNIDEVTYDEVFAAILLLAESVMTYEAIQITGYSVVMDMSNLSLRKARHLASPSLIRRFIDSFQNTMPIRLKCVHFVNTPAYWNILLSIGKRFMSKKLQEKLHSHGSDLISLHKFIPPEMLPEEFGGNQGPCAKYAEVFVQKMYDEEDHYIRIKSFGFIGQRLKELQKDRDLEDST